MPCWFAVWQIRLPYQLTLWTVEQLTDWLTDWLVYRPTGCWLTPTLDASKSISRGAAIASIENWAQLAEGKLITIRSHGYMFGCTSRVLVFLWMLITFQCGSRPSRRPTDEAKARSVLFQHQNPQRAQGWKIDRRGSNGAVDFVVIKEDNDWSC